MCNNWLKAALVLLIVEVPGIALGEDALRLPDAIPSSEQEASRTALYEAYAEAHYSCEFGKDGTGAELSKNQKANKCFETDTITAWVTAQGGCINDAYAAILTAAECLEVEACTRAHESEPEVCD